MKISGDDADFSGDTPRTSLIYFPGRFLVDVGVVKAKHGNGRSHHIHWIGSFWRLLDEIDHWIWQLPFGSERMGKFVELAPIWQSHITQHVNHFFVTLLACELVDVISYVQLHTILSSDL